MSGGATSSIWCSARRKQEKAMTEAEWLSSTDAAAMLDFLRGRGGDRKLRLFACACCRRVWRLILDPRHRRAVEVAERWADGRSGGEERAEARADLDYPPDVSEGSVIEPGPTRHAHLAARFTLRRAPDAVMADRCLFEAAAAEGTDELPVENRDWPDGDEWVRFLRSRMAPYAALLRCIFGNPIRPVTIAPEWLTSTVLALAKGIYDDRAFDRLPYLADALQDAGCTSDEVLEHCRGPNIHARGCWLIDGLLGKK